MPLIDVSFLLADPDFCTTIQLRPRDEAIGSNGRAVITDIWVDVIAVVVPARGRDLIRDDGSSRAGGTIVVYAQMPLTVGQNGEASGQTLSADRLCYRGGVYTVTEVEDWLEFGSGFVKAIAEHDGLS